MVISSDSKHAGLSAVSVDGSALQPSLSSRSKAAEAAGCNQDQTIMATIADDDDRLLVRIGYTPVSTLNCLTQTLSNTIHRSYKDTSQDGLPSHTPSLSWVSWAQCPLLSGLP